MSMRSEVERTPEELNDVQILADFLAFGDKLNGTEKTSLTSDQLAETLPFYIQSVESAPDSSQIEEDIPVLPDNEDVTVEVIEDKEDVNLLVLDLVNPVNAESKVITAPTHTIEFKSDLKGETVTVILPADAPRPEPVIPTSESQDVAAEDAFPSQQEYGKQFINEKNLENARNKLARISIELRGKVSRGRNQDLQTDYRLAMQSYKDAYSLVNTEEAALLSVDGQDDETIIGRFAQANETEHKRFLAAERTAYEEKYPHFGKLYDLMAKTGVIKRALASGGVGMAVTTFAGTAVAFTGVGAVVGGTVLMSVKAAKSVGMYKANKGMRTAKMLNKRAEDDTVAARNLKITDANIGTATVNASNTLINTIHNRIESDQKENRRSLKMAIGFVGVGAFLGTVVHEIRSSANPFKGLRPTLNGKPALQSSAVPTRTVEVPARLPGPITGKGYANNQLPVRPHATNTPHPSHNSTSRPNRLIEGPVKHGNRPTEVSVGHSVKPAEAIVPAPTRTVDTSRLTWSVAHDLTPGHEAVTSQHGIDAFNSLHGTHFALTPHNGSTWIIDNGRAINPAQMEELNRLMLDNLEITSN